MSLSSQLTTTSNSLTNGSSPLAQNSLLDIQNNDFYNQLPSIVSTKLSNTDFFYQPAIQPSQWNENFPYQLLMLQVNSSTDGTGQNNYNNVLYSYTLPFPPESLDLDLPFAITNQITL